MPSGNKITLEFDNFNDFFDFIRKTHDFLSTFDGKGDFLQEQLNQLKGQIAMTKEELLAKVASLKQDITDTLATELQQVKDAVQALKDKITAGTITPADLDEVASALDGISATVKPTIDSLSDQVV